MNGFMQKIVIIGAGPAGMMAAIRGSQIGASVVLIEKNPLPGRKLLLSGKGRCNLTNNSCLDSFLKRFSYNGEFLRDAFHKFFNQDLIEFFEKRGLKLKTERQDRVFPVSDRSESVLDVLRCELVKNKVKVLFKTSLKEIITEERKVKAVKLSDGQVIYTQKIILATGGLSYGFTGSTGDGINLAKKLGHNIVALRPGLVPLEVKQDYVRALNGLTLKNIRLKFVCADKKIVSEIGELLFSFTGVTGPLVLTLSAQIVDWLRQKRGVHLLIDLKPALSCEQLDQRLVRDFNSYPKRILSNILKELMPQRLIEVFIKLLGAAGDKRANQITQQERKKIVLLLKNFRFDIKSALPLEEAMVTRGGVSLKEINPKTMESRIIKGLYFAGEMIDVDADTGGFNLQAAFSTGYLAGESAAKRAYELIS
jgi:hypothetical protein